MQQSMASIGRYVFLEISLPRTKYCTKKVTTWAHLPSISNVPALYSFAPITTVPIWTYLDTFSKCELHWLHDERLKGVLLPHSFQLRLIAFLDALEDLCEQGLNDIHNLHKHSHGGVLLCTRAIFPIYRFDLIGQALHTLFQRCHIKFVYCSPQSHFVFILLHP
jgi:hypothetical protein